MSAFEHLRDRLSVRWPEHQRALARSFASDDHEHAKYVAGLILAIVGDELDAFIDDYRWTCEHLTQETLHFLREGTYRRSTRAEIETWIASEPGTMTRYVRGLLLSQLFWSNHRAVLRHLRERFLPQLPHGYHHLEIGPGHGLLSFMAASDPRCARAHAWEIDADALRVSTDALRRLESTHPESTTIELAQHDATQSPPLAQRFDSIVVSEVLEHVEDPTTLLSAMRGLLTEAGRVFINVPVNSPAPDHIVLLRSIDEAHALIENAGYDILEHEAYPQTGFDLARAQQRRATISCVIVARARSTD